jgi:hypothetical protein
MNQSDVNLCSVDFKNENKKVVQWHLHCRKCGTSTEVRTRKDGFYLLSNYKHICNRRFVLQDVVKLPFGWYFVVREYIDKSRNHHEKIDA